MKWTKVVTEAGKTLMVLIAASACSDSTTAPSRLVAEDSHSRYEYETVSEGGIEWVLVDGEWYPTVETADAVIEHPETMIALTGTTALYNADMRGYWDHITETIHWSFSGRSSGAGTAVKTGFTSVSPGSKYKRAFNTHRVYNVPTCNVTFSANTDHAAWFGKAAKITYTAGGGEVPLAVSIQFDNDVKGRIEATSIAWDYSPGLCPPSEECGPLTNLRPINPFTLANAGGALPSPTASFQCEPDPGEGDGGGYDGGWCYCQQWFIVVDGELVAEWWDCYDESGNPIGSCRLS